MDTKAAFEKWFESREIEMKKNGLGLISIARTKMRDWEAWTASRAAIEIELPGQENYDDPLSAYLAIKDCAEAITSHGIKVKS